MFAEQFTKSARETVARNSGLVSKVLNLRIDCNSRPIVNNYRATNRCERDIALFSYFFSVGLEKKKSCVCSIVSPLVSSNTRRERVLAKGSEREGRREGGLRHIEWVYVCL